MNTINLMPNDDIYIKLNNQIFGKIEGENLLAIVKENIKQGRKFLVDLSTVFEITSDGFHRLQEIITEANNAFCKMTFTNANDSVEELIISLTLNDES